VGNEIRKILLHPEPVALITGMGEENNFHPLFPKQYFFKSPPEAVKKLLQVGRAGRDIEKVLQRYLFG
jgi:hypothetical protein